MKSEGINFLVVPTAFFWLKKYSGKLHNHSNGVGADMIATMQKENFKEEKVTEKFSIISNRISDYRLKPRDYAVYCCLVKHSDKNGVCFPSRRLIAEECCIDKKTVDAAIISLEKAGLVKKKKRRRQDGSNTSNAYTVKLFR